MKRKFTVFLLSLTAGLCILSDNINALNLPDGMIIKKAPVSSVYSDYEENPEKYPFSPSLADKAGNAPIEINYNLPEKYDMREKNLVSPVKDQGIYGTCWAFSALSSMESSLIESNPFIDISEWHTAYYSTLSDDNINIYNYGSVYIPESAENTDFEQLFSLGGSSSLIVNNTAGWQGLADESRFPYCSYISDNEEDRYSADYHISDICLAFQNVYANERENIVSEVKDAVFNGNSVNVHFSSYDEFLNYETSSFFGVNENVSDDILESAYSSMHETAIIGWDDNYSRENFGGIAKPENDGAWLIKNSWGNYMGDSGYYWLSYEDEYIIFDASYSIEYAQEHDNIYQHDSRFGGWISSYSVSENGEGYMASVFTAQEDEYINGIGFYTTDNGTQYQADIYIGDFTDTPVLSDKPVLSAAGTEKYAGYHTIDFYDEAYIEKGQEYTIVINLSNPLNEYAVPMSEVPEYYDGSDRAEYENISFISADGINWIDTMKADGDYLCGIVCCKVFTDDADKIKFSEYSPYISRGEKIELSSYRNSDIYYSYDMKSWSLYTEPLQINSRTDIYASFSPDGEGYISESYELMPEYGDIDRDEAVTSYDALEILKHICYYSLEIEDVMQKYADTDLSGDISSEDALIILQYTAGLIDILPCPASDIS